MRNIYQVILDELSSQRELMYVSVTDSRGSVPRKKGANMLVNKNGLMFGTIGGGNVEYIAVNKAKELLAKKQSDVYEYNLTEESETGMACGGEVCVKYEYISPYDSDKRIWAAENADAHQGERAIVLGAGHIAVSLVPILDSIGFRVFVMDNREEYATSDRFPAAEKVICGDYCRISEYFDIDPKDYIVIMTDGHSHDFDLQNQILRTDTAYVGVVGSARKIAAVNAKLMAEGLSKQQCEKVHTPIGMKIGAVTPAEIAVSIAGEMIMIRAEKKEASF